MTTTFTYGRCSTCKGARVVPHTLGPRKCPDCMGWGCRGEPTDQWERIMLGLEALWGQGAQEQLLRPKRRVRLLPRRKKRT